MEVFYSPYRVLHSEKLNMWSLQHLPKDETVLKVKSNLSLNISKQNYGTGKPYSRDCDFVLETHLL